MRSVKLFERLQVDSEKDFKITKNRNSSQIALVKFRIKFYARSETQRPRGENSNFWEILSHIIINAISFHD